MEFFLLKFCFKSKRTCIIENSFCVDTILQSFLRKLFKLICVYHKIFFSLLKQGMVHKSLILRYLVHCGTISSNFLQKVNKIDVKYQTSNVIVDDSLNSIIWNIRRCICKIKWYLGNIWWIVVSTQQKLQSYELFFYIFCSSSFCK